MLKTAHTQVKILHLDLQQDEFFLGKLSHFVFTKFEVTTDCFPLLYFNLK